MRKTSGPLMAAVMLALSGPAAWAGEEKFQFFTPAEAAASVAKGSAVLSKQEGITEEMGDRKRSSNVETHGHLTDCLVILDGEATLTIGGTVVQNREVSPGEWRGESSTGGQVYALVPGAVVLIPPGTPHWIQVPPGGHVRYFAAKTGE